MKCKDCKWMGVLSFKVNDATLAITYPRSVVTEYINKAVRIPYCPNFDIVVDPFTERNCKCFGRG